MKKRLLSAALALAMVLTMLPLTAFAAVTETVDASYTANDNTDAGKYVTYYAKDAIPNVAGNDAGWYYHDTTNKVYQKFSTGLVSGTGNTGTWYANFDWANNKNLSNVTLIAPISPAAVNRDMTINLNGVTQTIDAVGQNVKNLTFTDTQTANGDPRGSVSIGSGLSVANRDFTLRLTNVKMTTGVNLTNNFTHSVYLDNAQIGAAVTLSGREVGKADRSQTLQLVNHSMITNAVSITGDSSSLTLNKSTSTAGTASSGSAITGAVTVTGTRCTVTANYGCSITPGGGQQLAVNGNYGTINLTDGTVYGTVKLDGMGSTLNVSGVSDIGNVILNSTYAPATDKATGAPPAINHTGTGDIGGIVQSTPELDKAAQIRITGGGSVSGASSTLTNADVTVTSSRWLSTATTLNKGSLTVSGTQAKGSTIGTLTLGRAGAMGDPGVSLKVSGENVTVGNVSADGSNNVPLTIDLSGATNSYGKLPKLADLKGGKLTVKGGTFAEKLDPTVLAGSGLKYVIVKKDNTVCYTSTIQEASEIYKSGVTSVATVNAATGSKKVTYKIGNAVVLEVFVTPGEEVELPSSLAGFENIKSWTNYTTKKDLPVGKTAVTDATTFIALNSSTHVATIDEIKSVSVDGIAAKLARTASGGTITLDGVVDPAAVTTIAILVDAYDGENEKKVTINVTCTVNNNQISSLMFLSANDPAWTVVGPNNAYLEVPGGGRYTLVNNLTVKNTSLKIGADSGAAAVSSQVKATVNVSGFSSTSNAALATAIEGAGSSVTFVGSPAVQNALAAVAKQVNGSVSSYISSAQRNYWTTIRKVNNPTAAQLAASPCNTVWIVPVMNIKVSEIDNAHMKFELVPSYKIVVNDSTGTLNNTNGQYEVNNGNLTALNLSGNAGQIVVKMNSTGSWTLPGTAFAHQDGKYVYTVTNPASAPKFTVTHLGTGTTLGSFVINSSNGLVQVGAETGTPATFDSTSIFGHYDSLQAAVDDTTGSNNRAAVHVDSTYKGGLSFSVTGAARTFRIYTEFGVSNKLSVTNPTDVEFLPDNNYREYKVTLKKNTTPVVTNATISVTAAANGSASASVTAAAPGATVSGTIRPNAGYRAGAFSATASTPTGNVSVSVSVNSANNTFSFVVPANATSVTVTPSFVLNTVVTTVPYTDVSSTAWYYPGVEYCYNTVRGSARLMQGMNDANTIFSPSSGFTRAQVVQILWNMKGRPAPRNTYNRFSDISSIHYAYNAMLWAVQNGYAEGYPDGTFRPNQYVTRQEMAVFLWRAAGKPTGYNTLNLNNYNDGNQVYDWAQPAMRWAVATGVLSGQGSVAVGRYLAPRAVAYRSEVAVTVMNFDKLAVFR